MRKMSKLLVVDDNEEVAELICEMLVDAGYEVSVSHDGRQVIERLDNGEKFDVIISDLIMPEIDGFGLLSELRDRHDETPVLVLSGGG